MSIKYLNQIILALIDYFIFLVHSTLFYFSENFKDYRCFLSNNFGPIYDTKLLCKEVKRMMPKNGLKCYFMITH